MSTRMEKYYKNSANTRSARNKELYDDIYTDVKYTNIEGVASITNANEIDITKIKEMLQNRENYQKQRQFRKITGEKEEEKQIPVTKVKPIEQRNYDIRDVLIKAKENKEPDDKERVLKSPQIDVLKNLNIKPKKEEDTEEELKDLIHTITNTSMLNKLKDVDLASDVLKDLTDAGEDKLTQTRSARLNLNNEQMDNTFFTNSLKLSKKDFEDGEGKKIGILAKIIIVILLLIIIGGLVLYFIG